MDRTPEMGNHVAFMEWFQNKYPELYMHCWKAIEVPLHVEGMTVEKDGMDSETYKSVIKIIKEYYQNENK